MIEGGGLQRAVDSDGRQRLGLRCPGLGGTQHVVSRPGGSGRGPPWRFYHGPLWTAHAAYEEDITRLGAQDEDSSIP